MRVVQANKAYVDCLGGIETVVQQLAEGFVRRHRLDSRVVACAESVWGDRFSLNGVQVQYAGSWGRLASLPISATYRRCLMRQSADILQLHEPFLLASASCLANIRAARRRFRRLVVWWHSDIVRQKIARPVYRPLLHGILREADAIVVATPNHVSSSELLQNYVEKCHVIHYGIDPRRFQDRPDSVERVSRLRSQFGGAPLIMFAGRLVYYKGVEYLVRAMKLLRDAHCVVVGDGPLRKTLVALGAGIPNVTFLPALADAEFVHMLKACDVFVLPSVERSEGFGIVQLEAMACGKPVVTCDLDTGVTYVNQHGKTGLVVAKRDDRQLADALRTLLDSPALRDRMGAYARARVLREFTVDGMVDGTVQRYRELLGDIRTDAPSLRAA